jgi:hypothetical protein
VLVVVVLALGQFIVFLIVVFVFLLVSPTRIYLNIRLADDKYELRMHIAR